jgi:glycerate dehydrogenase
VAAIGKALGMTVTLAERKGVPESEVRTGRTAFSTVIAESTVIMMTCPLDATTRNMIGEAELRTMRPDALVINVARGGVIVEEALVRALKEKWIAGAATDVFEVEPAGSENSVLVRAAQEDKDLNLTLSPHIAWYALSSTERLQVTVVANVEAFAAGQKLNEVF